MNTVVESEALDLAKEAEVFSKIVCTGTEKIVAKLNRTACYYISISFAFGFGFGMLCGAILRGVMNRNLRKPYLESKLDELLDEMQTFQKDFRHGLHPDSTKIQVGFRLDSDDEDEFYDMGSDNDTFLSPVASSSALNIVFSSTSHTDIRSISSVPENVLSELDDIADKASANIGPEGDSGPGISAFAKYLVYKKQYGNNPEYLWRFARAANLASKESPSIPRDDVANASTSLVIENLPYTSEDFQRIGLNAARKAVRLCKVRSVRDSLPAGTAAQAHKWLAIFCGLAAKVSTVNQRIEYGHQFKTEIDESIKLNPNDAYSRFLRGRWCYEVYNVTWVERQVASRLFASPPTATIQEALQEFLQAESLAPEKWLANRLFIAKCYIEIGDYHTAMEWLQKAYDLSTISASEDTGDERSHGEIVAELSSLLSSYRSYAISRPVSA